MQKKKNLRHKWKPIPITWIGKLNIVKTSIPPKVIDRFNVSSIKNPSDLFFYAEIEKPILKLIENLKGPGRAEIILNKEQHGRTQYYWLQNLLQNYSNQNSVVLT